MNMVEAYVNHGRWVADCPECNVGLQLPRGAYQVKAEFVMIREECVTCSAPTRVVWPDDPDSIDTALKDRPQINRNWYPHETVADLILENVSHVDELTGRNW